MIKLFNSSLSIQNLRYSKQTNRELSDSAQKLSSGSRIVKSSDDAAGLSISNKINATVRSQQQARRNTNDAFGVLQIMDGSLSELGNMVVRLRELSVQAASDTIGNEEREMLNLETQALLNEVKRIGESTEYMNRSLFKGEDYKLDIQVDTKNGKNDRISIDLKDMAQTPYALGLSGVSIDTKHRAKLSLARIDYAQNQILQSRTEVGATMNRLTSVVNNLEVSIQNKQAAKSQIRDLDFASETAKSVKNNIVQNSQVSVQTQIQNSGKSFLRLLK